MVYNIRSSDRWLRIGEMVLVIVEYKPLRIQFHYDQPVGPYVWLRGHVWGPVGMSGNSKVTALEGEEVFHCGEIQGKRIDSRKGNPRILFTGPPGFHVESSRHEWEEG